MRLFLALLLASFVAAFAAVRTSTTAANATEDWTQFRGPNGSGVSSTTGLPTEFGAGKNVVWKTALPPGHSSPVLTTDRIFVTGYSKVDTRAKENAHTLSQASPIEKENYKLVVIALDRQNGKILWQREVPRKITGRLQNVNNPASPSPVTDGANVYVFFQEFGLISFDANGKERWRHPLGPFNIFYGFGASPILVDDKVILPVDQDSPASYLIALDKNSGRVRWKVDRPVVISGYSTPIVYQPKQGPKQIVVPESFQLSAYSVADGKRIWWVRGLACEMKSVASIDDDTLYVNGWGFGQNQAGTQIATVDFAEGLKRLDTNGDGFIGRDETARESKDRMERMLRPEAGFDAFDGNRDGKLDAKDWEVFRAMLAAENGLMAITLGGSGDMTATAVKWKYLRPVPQVPSTVLYEGVLFMVNDSGILISFNPQTGEVIKQGRLKGAIDKYFASPIGADGKVWLVSQDGTLSVVSAKGEWEVLQVNTLDDEVFATPVPADGELFVRTRSALYNFAK